MPSIPLHRIRTIHLQPDSIISISVCPPCPPSSSSSSSSSSTSESATVRGITAVGRKSSIQLFEFHRGLFPIISFPVQLANLEKISLVPRFPQPSGGDYSTDTAQVFTAARRVRLLVLLSGKIVEICMVTGTVKNELSIPGGSVWSFAASPSGHQLAVGSEDGCIRIVDLNESSEMEWQVVRKCVAVRSRLLCIAWGPVKNKKPQTQRKQKSTSRQMVSDSDDSDSDKEEADMWTSEYIVAGSSDSSARKISLATGQILQTYTTERASHGSGATLVWDCIVLRDGTVVLADSLGHISMHDEHSRFAHFPSHVADALCLAQSNEGLFSAGVDQKVVHFVNSTKSGWVQAGSRKLHTHDVRSIVVSPPYNPFNSSLSRSRTVDILFSGGIDLSLVMTPCGGSGHNPITSSADISFTHSTQRRLPFSPLPGSATVLIPCRSENRELVTLDLAGKIRIQRIAPMIGPQPYANMDLKFSGGARVIAVNQDCSLLAVSDFEQIKMFRLSSDRKGRFIAEKLSLAKSLKAQKVWPSNQTSCSSIAFSPDGHRLVLTPSESCHVIVVELNKSNGIYSILRVFQPKLTDTSKAFKAMPFGRDQPTSDSIDFISTSSSNESLKDVITRTTISSDGAWLCTMKLSRQLDIYNLDSLQHLATLPTPRFPVAAFSFNPVSPQLVLCLSDNTVQVYALESRSMLAILTPTSLKQQLDFAIGICWQSSSLNPRTQSSAIASTSSSEASNSSLSDFKKQERMVIYGPNWVGRLDVSEQLKQTGRSRKRHRASAAAVTSITSAAALELEAQDEHNFNLISTYRSILAFGFTGTDEMCVVERPWQDVLASLPKSFNKKYGR